MTDNLYYYSATVKKVVDGDTIHCQVDLGFGVNFYDMDFRFAGINAPETRGETRVAGLESKSFLTDLLLNKPVIVQTIKDKQEKYGRYLAIVHVKGPDGWINVNELLLQKGLAVKFM